MATLLSKFADGLVGRFENWRARERAYRELASLDDRSLADIGLTRSDIPHVFDRKPVEQTGTPAEPVYANTNIRHAA